MSRRKEYQSPVTLSVRVEEAEAKAIRKAARLQGLSVSDWMRRAGMTRLETHPSQPILTAPDSGKPGGNHER